MTTIRAGEIWIANIFFTNAIQSKKRSVLILWLDGDDAIVAVVTAAKPRTETDVPLDQWQESGLRKPSTVRLARLNCLEQSTLIARIGALSNRDAEKISQLWALHIKPQF